MRRKEETAGLEARYHAVVHSNTPAAAVGTVVAAAASAAASAAAAAATEPAVAAAESEMFVEDRQSRTGLSRAYETNGSGKRERARGGRAGEGTDGRTKESSAAAEFWVGLLDWEDRAEAEGVDRQPARPPASQPERVTHLPPFTRVLSPRGSSGEGVRQA